MQIKRSFSASDRSSVGADGAESHEREGRLRMPRGEIKRAEVEYRPRSWSVVPVRTREKVLLTRWEPFQKRRAGN